MGKTIELSDDQHGVLMVLAEQRRLNVEGDGWTPITVVTPKQHVLWQLKVLELVEDRPGDRLGGNDVALNGVIEVRITLAGILALDYTNLLHELNQTRALISMWVAEHASMEREEPPSSPPFTVQRAAEALRAQGVVFEGRTALADVSDFREQAYILTLPDPAAFAVDWVLREVAARAGLQIVHVENGQYTLQPAD